MSAKLQRIRLAFLSEALKAIKHERIVTLDFDVKGFGRTSPTHIEVDVIVALQEGDDNHVCEHIITAGVREQTVFVIPREAPLAENYEFDETGEPEDAPSDLNEWGEGKELTFPIENPNSAKWLGETILKVINNDFSE